MSTTIVNLSSLAASLKPAAILGSNGQPATPRSGVSMTAAAAKPAAPVVVPYTTKAASDASKKTFSVPYQAKAIPENETADEELARLRSENESLKAAKATGSRVSFKVSEKGAVSAYGLGRFPVTLYGGQWARLLQAVPELVGFLKANAGSLATKE